MSSCAPSNPSVLFGRHVLDKKTCPEFGHNTSQLGIHSIALPSDVISHQNKPSSLVLNSNTTTPKPASNSSATHRPFKHQNDYHSPEHVPHHPYLLHPRGSPHDLLYPHHHPGRPNHIRHHYLRQSRQGPRRPQRPHRQRRLLPDRRRLGRHLVDSPAQDARRR
ncbi:hypothetical protein B0T18DRAFT_420436 [Schizothecium vesticola]|uniref:Uncharacterized protein n=1 Tax=Schizothecium vesticola TaxID=314040 RepID=A0AA40BP14_9PEZI|nr:hypothetical protein B0T18DRAFT_420436 [Schizothecium vesticola]